MFKYWSIWAPVDLIWDSSYLDSQTRGILAIEDVRNLENYIHKSLCSLVKLLIVKNNNHQKNWAENNWNCRAINSIFQRDFSVSLFGFENDFNISSFIPNKMPSVKFFCNWTFSSHFFHPFFLVFLSSTYFSLCSVNT